MGKDPATFEPKEILCPIDFSELSDLALKYAAAGADQFGANLTVFHAAQIDVPRYFTRDVAEKITDQIRSAGKDFQAQMELHVTEILGPAARQLSLRYIFMESHPVDAILKTAEKERIDLIVMGTRGFGGVKKLLMGSVAHGVFESARIPLFTVKQKAHDFIDVTRSDALPQIRNILCPCNTKASAGLSLRYAASLAERFNAALTILKIYEGEDAADISAMEEEFCGWVSSNVQAHCELRPIDRRGNAAEQIINYAIDEKSDLIVLSARHHLLQGGTFFGRTTELVARHAPLPVLTVPIT